jgi:hypothetical protein
MSELDDLRAAAARQLDEQASRAATYQAYYDNEAGIVAQLEPEERRIFKAFLDESSANWCELVVHAVAERLSVVGFRFGDEAADDLAWTLWQASSMDADSELVQTDALVTGSSFVLVQPDEDNPTGVSMTGESPEEATVLYVPGTRRKRLAGYKRFADEPSAMPGRNQMTEVLILPDQIVTWLPGPQRSQPVIEPNPAGTVNLVELVPQPRTGRTPRSELKSAISIQDRINTVLFNRAVAMDYGAFRQIWASGLRIARGVVKTDDGQATQVVRPFDIGAQRLLVNENPEGRFGAFAESTLRGYLDSVEQDVNMLAAITQTPPHYLLGSMVNLSADAIKAAEAGLVAKVGRRALHLGEGWEDAIRLALGLVGSPAAANVRAEVVWRDFETRSLAQLADSLTKIANLGIPRTVLWERWGATPQEVERWRDLASQPGEIVTPPTRAALAPAPTPAGGPATP